MWLGLDDTDSPKGGCTTWVMAEVLREVQERDRGIDLVGAPRLVRLNPNVPFKTRGNAALAARFGRGRGPCRTVGRRGVTSLRAYARAAPLTPAQSEDLWSIALEVVHRAARWGEPGTDPAIVLSPTPLPADLYWRAVREPVRPDAVWGLLEGVPGVRVAAYGSGEGVVGASAALAWPARRRTWEAIAYRSRERWGLARELDTASVRRVVRRFPESFLSYDERTRRVLVAPHTPCPILFGIRGTSADRLPKALSEVRVVGEDPERWVLFQTNQATGDHLVGRTTAQAGPGTSGVFEGVVREAPRDLRGGHVTFGLEDREGRITCVAFEPSKTLAPIARSLLVGDRLRVWGSVPWSGPSPTRPASLRLEGLTVLSARPAWEKGENPKCPRCGKRTDSIGRGKGFRCPTCRHRLPPEAAPGVWRARGDLRGAYLPTPSARRHLSPRSAPAPLAPFYRASRP